MCVRLHACLCGSVCLCTLPLDAPPNSKKFEDLRVHLKMIIGPTAFLCFSVAVFFSFDRICLKLKSLIASPQRVPVNHLGQGVFLGPDGIQLEHPISLYIHIQSPKTFVHDGHPSLLKVFFFSLVIFFCKPDGCFFLPPSCVLHTHYICQCV